MNSANPKIADLKPHPLGIEPYTTTYDGDSPVTFVLSANLQRRHLSASQRAMVAADAMPHFESEAKKRQRGQAYRVSIVRPVKGSSNV